MKEIEELKRKKKWLKIENKNINVRKEMKIIRMIFCLILYHNIVFLKKIGFYTYETIK